MNGLNGIAQARTELDAGRSALVWRKAIADTVTPVGAARALMQEGRGDFLLESVEGGETRARYSLLGLAPDLVFRATGDRAEINRDWALQREAFAELAVGPIDALRALQRECLIDVPEGLPPALACLVGYFAYETLGLIEKLPRPSEGPLQLPEMLFVRPSILLVFDRLEDSVYVVAPLWADRDAADAEKQIEDGSDRIDAALSALHAAPERSNGGLPIELPEPALAATMSADRYREMVLRAKEYITAGDIFQVVLSQRFTCDFPLPPLSLYRALRRVNPSPFLYFLDMPGFALIGSSPEILVRVREGQVTVRPIAGTRPRGRTDEEDRAVERELLADPKENAEHLMLLDLGRNDVGRVASRGSVCVKDSFFVERYSHVMHIVSEVTGELDESQDALDALFAGFPAGTVSGAPKVRACQIIGELEPTTRGPYAGGVGYFAPDGSIDSCIVLRTGLLKDGTLHVQAGAGIVADSDPEYEQRECEAKANALIAAAREAIRVHEETGYGQ